MKKLIEKYGLEVFGSGGGHIHFAQFIEETPHSQKYWLINPWVDADEDWLNELPTHEDQICLFGFQDWSEDPSNEISFKAPLSEGLERMKTIFEEVKK